MNWLEFSVEVDLEAVESVSDLLAQYGYNGGVAIDQPIIPSADGPEYSYDPSRPVVLRTYIPVDEHANDTRSRIEQALWHFRQIRPVGPLRVTVMEDQDWANSWKQHYTVQHIGQRTVIVPSWLEYEAQPDDIVLRLDPGMAFGTGLHPTTQLCLVLLERYVKPGMAILDIGSGSGILSIAAARLGAENVLALDTDPIAVDATNINVRLNNVEQHVRAIEGSLGGGATLGHWMGWDTEPQAQATDSGHGQNEHSPPEMYDLIVANIIARVLSAMAMDMAAALQPGGVLISSGIIADREDEVALAYAAAGLERIERHQEGDWVALVHTRV